MKLSLRLLAQFLFNILLVTVVGGLLYMFYKAATTLVAGQMISTVSLSLFVKGLVYTTPFSVVFSELFMALYLVRHPKFSVLPVVVYVLLCAVCWAVVLPLYSDFSTRSTAVPEPTETVPLSPGFFRQNDETVFYYATVAADNTTSGLCIDISERAGTVYTYSDVRLPAEGNTFADSLIARSIQFPLLLTRFFERATILCDAARIAQYRGCMSWLCFASLGLALMSALCFRRFSAWKLINGTLVIASTLALLELNALYYQGLLFPSVVAVLNRQLPALYGIRNPCLVLFNLAVFVVFSVLGLVFTLCSRHREGEK